MPSPAFAWLPAVAQTALTSRVKTKFDAYFLFASNHACVRSSRLGTGWLYSNESLISDLMVLWALFCEVHEVLVKEHGLTMPNLCAQDQRLVDQFDRIFNEQGEYWESPGGAVGTLQRVANPVPASIAGVCKTLRNGYAHFHWLYENLSASDYWTRQAWDIAGAIPAFGLPNRPVNNYMAYVADAVPPRPNAPPFAAQFWNLPDLRILVARYTTLRFSLHLFLNVLLNDSLTNVFDQ